MKQTIICMGLLLYLVGTLTAQDSSTGAPGIAGNFGTSVILRKKIFKTTIILANGSVNKGYLASLSDSVLSLSPYPLPVQSGAYPQHPWQTFDYSSLQTVRLQRKASLGRGLLYGALTGLTVGVLAGMIEGSDPDQTVQIPDFFGAGSFSFTVRGTTSLEKSIVLGATGMLTGAIIGGVIGLLSHKKFTLRGKRQKFLDMRSSVFDSIYTHQTDTQ
jgi:hypothetical protein